MHRQLHDPNKLNKETIMHRMNCHKLWVKYQELGIERAHHCKRLTLNKPNITGGGYFNETGIRHGHGNKNTDRNFLWTSKSTQTLSNSHLVQVNLRSFTNSCLMITVHIHAIINNFGERLHVKFMHASGIIVIILCVHLSCILYIYFVLFMYEF